MADVYKDLLAGCVAGSSSVLLGHPLDTVKARVQISRQFAGIRPLVRQMLRSEGGLPSLYRGLAAPFVCAGLLNALLFAGYTVTLRALRGPLDSNLPLDRAAFSGAEILLASTVGTLLQLVPAIPIELVKTRLQTARKRNGGPLRCALHIVKSEGLLGLYRGGSVMMWRDLVGYMFYLPAYECFRKWLHSRGMGEGAAQLLAGGMAGSVSWVAICPLELVKNRIQAATVPCSVRPNPWVIVRQVYFETSGGGRSNPFRTVAGFYRGGLVLALRAFPVNACVFFVHEQTLGALEREKFTHK